MVISLYSSVNYVTKNELHSHGSSFLVRLVVPAYNWCGESNQPGVLRIFHVVFSADCHSAAAYNAAKLKRSPILRVWTGTIYSFRQNCTEGLLTLCGRSGETTSEVRGTCCCAARNAENSYKTKINDSLCKTDAPYSRYPYSKQAKHCAHVK